MLCGAVRSLAAASRMSQTPMLPVRSVLLAAPSLCCSLHRTAAAPFAAVTSRKKLIKSGLVFWHLLQQRMELLPPCSKACGTCAREPARGHTCTHRHTHTHTNTHKHYSMEPHSQFPTLPTLVFVMSAKQQQEDWMLEKWGGEGRKALPWGLLSVWWAHLYQR